MPLLVSNEIFSTICKELALAEDSVQIITAYCKKNTLSSMINNISPSVQNKKLMLRFRMDDIVKGSTDFDVVEMCMQQGWDVYVRFDLHAKTYIVDNKRGIVGSANATTSGMLGTGGNFEIATLDQINDTDVKKIDALYNDALKVDTSLVNTFKSQLAKVDNTNDGTNYVWSKEITSRFSPKIKTLFSHEFPDEGNYSINDYIPFLDITYNGNKHELKESLRWSNAYMWLLNVLEENEGCLYFGGLSERLHNAIVSDPKPYRKDVKALLANLLNMIDVLGMEEVVIDRPNYSQRVQLVK